MEVVESSVRPASYSELMAHRKCPQHWFYRYGQSLERDESEDAAVERDTGSWWQALLAAEALERGRKLGTLQAVPRAIKTVDGGPWWAGDEVTPFDVQAGAEQWWHRQHGDRQDLWIERLGGQDLPTRLGELWVSWFAEWAEDRDSESPLAVELRWKRALPSRVDDPPMLVGYIDEVYLDRRRNVITVRDNKLHRTLQPMTSADDMMDSQLQLYAWGAAPIVREWNLGPIKATGYDRTRMVAPKSPQVTQSGTLSKSVTDYDVHAYQRWARGPDGQGVPYPGRAKDGSGAGLYLAEDSVIEKLSTPAARSAWFQRTRTPLNVNVIRAHLRAAIDSVADVARSRARVAVSHEAARNLTSGCRFCDFVKLCRVQMIGGADGDYDLADYGLRVRPGPGK